MKATDPAVREPLRTTIAEQLRRTLDKLAVVHWFSPLQSGESGQYADRDLQLARREREEQKGRD